MDVLDEGDYTIGQILEAISVLINSAALEVKAAAKMRQEPLYFVDDPHGLYAYLK